MNQITKKHPETFFRLSKPDTVGYGQHCEFSDNEDDPTDEPCCNYNSFGAQKIDPNYQRLNRDQMAIL